MARSLDIKFKKRINYVIFRLEKQKKKSNIILCLSPKQVRRCCLNIGATSGAPELRSMRALSLKGCCRGTLCVDGLTRLLVPLAYEWVVLMIPLIRHYLDDGQLEECARKNINST